MSFRNFIKHLFILHIVKKKVCTLEFQINVPVHLLIFGYFSHQYALIWTGTFIVFEHYISFAIHAM